MRFRKRYGSFDYAPYRTPYDRRHVYMDNKLKCVNMMAAKRFKTGAFGKLARMKGDTLLSPVSVAPVAGSCVENVVWINDTVPLQTPGF